MSLLHFMEQAGPTTGQVLDRAAGSWYDPDVLGIDLGISVLMTENLRSGLVWETFMRNLEATAAMRACGFRNT